MDGCVDASRRLLFSRAKLAFNQHNDVAAVFGFKCDMLAINNGQESLSVIVIPFTEQ